MIVFKREEWSAEAAEKLLPLVFPPVRIDFITDVQTGRVCLWRVEKGGEFLAWLATSISSFGSEIELVLECIHGKESAQIVEELKSKAKKLGVKSIRFESIHSEKAVKRIVGDNGFERYASVFRCELL